MVVARLVVPLRMLGSVITRVIIVCCFLRVLWVVRLLIVVLSMLMWFVSSRSRLKSRWILVMVSLLMKSRKIVVGVRRLGRMVRRTCRVVLRYGITRRRRGVVWRRCWMMFVVFRRSRLERTRGIPRGSLFRWRVARRCGRRGMRTVENI